MLKPLAITGKHVLRMVGFFPGLGSRRAYIDLGSTLYDTGMPEVQDIYIKSARVLDLMKDGKPDHTRLFFNNAKLPDNPIKKYTIINRAFFTNSLAMEAYFRTLLSKESLPVEFAAFTGESIGILVAAVTVKSLSLSVGVKLADFLMTRTLLDAEQSIKSAHYIFTIESDQIDHIVMALENRFGNRFEVYKTYSHRLRSVYVDDHVLNGFNSYMENSFPETKIAPYKIPKKYITHTRKLTATREQTEKFIWENNIRFDDPVVPILSNNNSGVLTTGEEVKEAVLAIATEPMHSQATAQLVDRIMADFVIEIGPGRKAKELLQHNNVKTPYLECTGNIVSDLALLNVIKEHTNARSRGTAFS